MLSAVTYNVFLGRTFEPLFNWLFLEHPLQDIYCFQEFPENKLNKISNYASLNGYKTCFAPGFTWRGLTYGELTIFNSNKLKLKSTKTIALGGKGEKHLVFFRDRYKLEVKITHLTMDKTALLTDFEYKNKKLSLINAHLCSDVYNSRKLDQVDRILDEEHTQYPSIILGDFNYPIGSGLIKRMANREFTSASVNQKTLTSPLLGQKTFRFGPGIYWQNDYVFHRQCKVHEVTVKLVQHSDHYPIFFKVELDDPNMLR